MENNIFTEKKEIPDQEKLAVALGLTYPLWQTICEMVQEKYPAAISEWNFPGEKYGWSYRIKDKKRAILYLLPRERYFMVAFVFGQKAFDKIMVSGISENIKTELKSAKPYAEGRGIRLAVKNKKILKDIAALTDFKLAH